MQTPKYLRRSLAALALALCLGSCPGWGNDMLVLESKSGPAEVWINGVHAGDAPLELDVGLLSSFFVPEFEPLTRSSAAMDRAAAGSGAAGSGAAGAGYWSSGGGSFASGSYVIYGSEPVAAGPDPIEYVCLFRELDGGSAAAGPVAGGFRVSLRTPGGPWLSNSGVSSRSLNGVTTKRLLFEAP